MKALLALPLVLAAGCAGAWKEVRRAPAFAPTEAAPVRIAVPPFRDETGGRSPLVYPLLPILWVANLALLRVPESDPDSTEGAEVLRALLVARLRGSSLNVVDPRAVDTTLHHLELLERAHDVDPVELGGRLGVDAIVLGTLRSWGPRYYVVETRTIVEAEIRILSCVDGGEIFRGAVGLSDAAGITGGPTVYVSAAATPLAALGSGPYQALAIEWSERMGAELAGGVPTREGAPAPYIAVAALSSPPAEGFRAGETVEVFAIGAPGCRASFDIGTLRVRVPMCEVARIPRTGDPAAGEISAHYRGAYSLTEDDGVLDAPVFVTLEGAGGRASAVAENGPVTVARSGQSPTARPPRRGSE